MEDGTHFRKHLCEHVTPPTYGWRSAPSPKPSLDFQDAQAARMAFLRAQALLVDMHAQSRHTLENAKAFFC